MNRDRIFWFLGLVVLLAGVGIHGCGAVGQKAAANDKPDPKTFKPAPDVTFKGLDGKEVSLASL
jgi:hypothetical protein